MINLLQNLYNYTHRTVSAADMNRAKVSLYEMLEAAHKSGANVFEVSGYHEVTLENILNKINYFNLRK